MTPRAISYRPPGPVARAFMMSDAFVRGIRGPYGSGKSVACCMEILRRAGRQAPGADGLRRTRWAVVRNTYPELKTTTIKTWHDWVPQSLGRWQADGPPTHRVRLGDVDLEVIFLALDRPEDARKLLSLELTGAWINEARDVPKAILDALTGRVGRYPAAKDGGASWSGIIMDTNPPDTDHWWYRLAEEERPEGWAFFAQPGGRSPGAENRDHLPPAYYERQMAGKDPNWIRVYIDGEYGFVQDGKPVFPEYKDHVHCRPLALDPRLPVHVGLDFGLTPAAVFGQRAANGQWRWLSELVAVDMGTVRFAELLGAEMRSRYAGCRFEVIGDPAGDSRAQTDERTPFDILRAAGIDARPAPSNDPNLRQEAIRVPLTRMIDGEPGLLIDPACRVLRKAMAGAYRYRRLQVSGQQRFHDVPEKNAFSHVADAAQYLMLGAGEGRAIISGPVRNTALMQMSGTGGWSPFDW